MPYLSADELRQRASGNWIEILSAAGIPTRVLDSRNHPCPKCGGRDRFAAFRDLPQRGAVHCRHCFTRNSEIAPGDGIQTLRWWLGTDFSDTLQYLADSLGYRATDGPLPGVPRPLSTSAFSAQRPQSIEPIDEQVIEAHTRFAREAYHRMDMAMRTRLAKSLSLAPFSLTSLRVGISADGNCSTWPMRDATERIIGVRIISLPWTSTSSAKWSRPGSHSGLFIPREGATDRSRLFITEGASDTAAANSVGLFAIGRSSCNSSTYHIYNHIRRHQPKRITVIADNDPPGRRGANRLASTLSNQLASPNQSVEVICPPVRSMDLRDWIAQGANQVEICRIDPITSIQRPVQTLFDFDSMSESRTHT